LGHTREPEPFPLSQAWVLDNPIAKLHAKRVMKMLSVKPGMHVLDVGAGTGRLALPLAEKVAAEGEVVATDLQPEMLERLKRRARERDIPNIRTLIGAAGETNLPCNSFDLCIVASVLGEVPEQAREPMLREIFDSLKPGGVLAVVESKPDPHFQAAQDVADLGKRVGLRVIRQRRLWLGFVMEFMK
jgi:ubiquinone/menaquinone biosynthesis C-methylase UbiE